MSELKAIRKAMGLTQAQMARAIGIGLSAYQAAEPTPRLIHLLAARWVLHCHLTVHP